MENRVQDKHSEFTPQMAELRAMARQDVAVARERFAEGGKPRSSSFEGCAEIVEGRKFRTEGGESK